MTAEKAAIKSGRFSAFWLVPLLALAVSVWLVVNAYRERGPEIKIIMTTADGIVEGKTKIKALNVEIGTVESIELSPDYQSVIVKAQIEKSAQPLLRDDTLCWVVKPRVGAGGISGMGTLLSGAFIQLSPGKGKTGKRMFQALDTIPATANGVSGLRIELHSEESGLIRLGDPVLYRGYRVGRVETAAFNVDLRRFSYQAFIDAPYDQLVTANTRFWNVSGFSFKADSKGFTFQSGSIESLLGGGVAFDLPARSAPGEKAQDQHAFELHPNRDSINEETFEHYAEYLLLFDTSVRGLKPGSPVEYRGLKVGSVVDVSFDNLSRGVLIESNKIPIPALIRLEPGRLGWEDNAIARETLEYDIAERVDNGLRASLKMGSLLTGQLYVSLDFHDNAEPAAITPIDDHLVLPTISNGIAQIENKVITLLDTLAELPLKQTLGDAGEALIQIKQTLSTADTTFEELNEILTGDAIKEVPEALTTTLHQLRQTLEGFSPDAPAYQDLEAAADRLNTVLDDINRLIKTIENKPNSLIFSGSRKKDPEPKAKQK